MDNYVICPAPALINLHPALACTNVCFGVKSWILLLCFGHIMRQLVRVT